MQLNFDSPVFLVHVFGLVELDWETWKAHTTRPQASGFEPVDCAWHYTKIPQNRWLQLIAVVEVVGVVLEEVIATPLVCTLWSLKICLSIWWYETTIWWDYCFLEIFFFFCKKKKSLLITVFQVMKTLRLCVSKWCAVRPKGWCSSCFHRPWKTKPPSVSEMLWNVTSTTAPLSGGHGKHTPYDLPPKTLSHLWTIWTKIKYFLGFRIVILALWDALWDHFDHQ